MQAETSVVVTYGTQVDKFRAGDAAASRCLVKYTGWRKWATRVAMLLVIAAGVEEQEGGRRVEGWGGRGSRGGESMAPGPNGGAQDKRLGRAGALQR
jgi:hypothetical protein